MIYDPRDKLVVKVKELLSEFGIEPLYLATFLMLVILISYKKELERWEELDEWRRRLIITTAIGFGLFFILSVLIFFGVIDPTT